MPPKKMDNTTKNFYAMLPPHLKSVCENPDVKHHGLTLPFRGLIVGASGSGKSTLCLELLSRMPRTFTKVVLVCRSAAEPLYRYIVETSDPDTLEVFEFNNDGLPAIDDYKGAGNKLIIYDDLISLSKQELKPVVDAFIRGRKFNVSLLFLTQAYYQAPKTIRLQCNLMFLKKIGSSRDLGMILRETSLGLNQEQLLNIYKKCTKEQGDFLLIKLDSSGEEGKFFHNLLAQVLGN